MVLLDGLRVELGRLDRLCEEKSLLAEELQAQLLAKGASESRHVCGTGCVRGWAAQKERQQPLCNKQALLCLAVPTAPATIKERAATGVAGIASARMGKGGCARILMWKKLLLVPMPAAGWFAVTV